MTERNRPAVDVDLRGIPAEILIDCASLRGKCLISLHEIEVSDVPASFLECRARCRNGPGTHDGRINPRMRPGYDARERHFAELGGLACLHEHDGAGAVVDARGIASSDRAVLGECRPQLGYRLERRSMFGMFVSIDDDIAFTRLHSHLHDLVLELSRLLRSFRLVLGGHRELVLLRAGDLPLARDVLGRVAHMIAVESIPKAVLDHGIDHVEVAHFHAATQMGAVRRLAHGFLPPGDHDFGVAVENGLVPKRDRAQAGPAKLVDAPGRSLHGDTRSDRGLAGRVLALTGRENLTHDDLGDLRPLDPGALERLLDGNPPEFVSGKSRERSIEGPDGCAGGGDDDNIVLHFVTPSVSGWTAADSPIG